MSTFANIILLIYYCAFHKNTLTFNAQIPIWVWVIYAINILMFRFVDGLQNNTRNIARITLLKMGETDLQFDRRGIIKEALHPSYTLTSYTTLHIISVISFSFFLFKGGWGLAILTSCMTTFGLWFFVPMWNRFHIQSIRTRFESMSRDAFNARNNLLAIDINIEVIKDILEEALMKNIDLQVYWRSLSSQHTQGIASNAARNELNNYEHI